MPCAHIASNMGQLSDHIRRRHLGVAVTCHECGYRAWMASLWLGHMKRAHPDMEEEKYYLEDDYDTAEIIIKIETAEVPEFDDEDVA